MIQIRRFEDVYPEMQGRHLRNWQAQLLAGSGRDHYLLCRRLHQDLRQNLAGAIGRSPSYFVSVTLMQQTLEFLLKALADRDVAGYDPKKNHTHNLVEFVDKYATVPTLAPGEQK